MNAPSEPTRAALTRLQAVAWSGGIHATEIVRLVRQLAAAGEAAAVPALYGLLHSTNDDVADAAAEAIDATLRCLPPSAIAGLDPSVRALSERWWPVAGAAAVPYLARGRTGTLGTLSWDASGYVREAALRLLSAGRDGSELPFLLLRLNDWVGAVREAAWRAVAARVRDEYAPHLVRCLPLVDRLRQQGRGEPAEAHAAVMALLRRPSGRAALEAGLVLPDRQTVRLAFTFLADDAGDADRPGVLIAALAAADTQVRLWAARRARRELDGEPLRAALDRMRRDRFMPVRREALYGRAERLRDGDAAELWDALVDPHASVREAARFHLRQRGVTAERVADHYRTAAEAPVGDDRQAAAAAAGLGEVGVAADADRLTSFLVHPSARVRRAAVRAVARLDPSAHEERIVAALSDAAAGVARAARDAARAGRVHVPPDRLRALVQAAGEPAHVRRLAVSLVAGLPWWEGAATLVEAAGSDDPVAAAAAAESLRRWRSNAGRLTCRPTPKQLDRLASALAAHRHRLEPATADDVAVHVEYARLEWF